MPSRDFTKENEVTVYGSPGNEYGQTMVGGQDVVAINAMLEKSFLKNAAGVGDPVVKIGEYKGRSVFEQKAADQIRISLDDEGNAYVKLIIRQLDPGLGLVALAGGFKDAGETDEQAADREEEEEAKSDTGVLIAKYEIARHPVKGDVRVWGGADRADGVKKSDIIAMSTMAMISVVRNAHSYVDAGDDATSAGWVRLSDISDTNVFGIQGHAAMLLEAVKLAGLQDQLLDSFEQSLIERIDDIAVASEALKNEASILLDSSIKAEVAVSANMTATPS